MGMDILKQLKIEKIDKKIEMYRYVINELEAIKKKVDKEQELHSTEESFLESIFFDENCWQLCKSDLQ